MEKDNEYTKILEKVKENIRRIRKERGYKSAQKFADDLGVSLKTVQGWENLDNGRWPDLSMMLKVCELTGYDLDYFTGRLEAPTHEIDFIHKKTGLSMKAVSKLIANKETVIDSPLSDIIEHKNSGRLLRALLLATDNTEIAWMNLDNLPSELLSSSAGKTIDSSTGLGSSVAESIAGQELTIIARDIRTKRNKVEIGWDSDLSPYIDRMTRDKMLKDLETVSMSCISTIDNPQCIVGDLTEEDITAIVDSAEKRLEKSESMIHRIKGMSYSEWKRGNIQEEFDDFMREVHGNNG